MLAAGSDLVNNILDASHAESAKTAADRVVIGDGNALAADLQEAALVDEFPDSLNVGVAVGDERFHTLQHVQGSLGEGRSAAKPRQSTHCKATQYPHRERSHLGEADENSVVNLTQTKELQNLSGLGMDAIDTEERKQ